MGLVIYRSFAPFLLDGLESFIFCAFSSTSEESTEVTQGTQPSMDIRGQLIHSQENNAFKSIFNFLSLIS